ncbi:hypothetical protein WSK_1163 [Novosphingobium sp. Rr 2-17]|uniref:hypothetical protein n=1 Tax=Novosphingobium sp. Rr 2-17 TaxID=555793 RepID=UPI000269A7C9|nr:hypothetical protein [Novosphingobium sp. Rr 2-17]EIZ80130.1 hypothetical protein WSK_1163 [Novosphingobium sp. Rr 2-17]
MIQHSAIRLSSAQPRRVLIAALLLAAFALAIALRLRQSASPMVFDEYASMYFSQRSWGELWGWWMVRETNPPLFYSVLKLWRGVVPANDAALRLLPLLLSLAQMALLAKIAGRVYGGFAAVLVVVLFAVGPSDIYQSEYLRAYVLAKLAVTVSFAGLIYAVADGPKARRGWATFIGGAVVAIYCHTTMLLWPPIAALAALVEWTVTGKIERRKVTALLVSGLAIMALSGWVLIIAVLQLRAHAGDISWIQPLSLEDYASSIDLQILQDAPIGSSLMGCLIALGVVRTWRNPATRLALVIVPATLIAYKLADTIHPITSDFTLHWCATFTVLLAAAALANWKTARRGIEQGFAAAVAVIVAAVGWYELQTDVWIPQPQDFRYASHTVANTPRAALLASHESIAVVISQGCKLEFARPDCPFPFVVLANPAKSDSWSDGGYGKPLVPVAKARQALGNAKTVYAFSRYVYTPLDQLGIDARRYRHVEWDDGELIGPIPIADIPARPRAPIKNADEIL